MPAITACNNYPVSLPGISYANYPSENSQNMVAQYYSNVYMPSGNGQTELELQTTVIRNPQTGLLDFSFWMRPWASVLSTPWSPPANFSVKWVNIPGLKITYADYIVLGGGYYAPSTFAWGPSNFEFRFGFNPAPPAINSMQIFFVTTNATHWAANQGALATFFANPGGPRYPTEMVLPSPIVVKPATGRMVAGR